MCYDFCRICDACSLRCSRVIGVAELCVGVCCAPSCNSESGVLYYLFFFKCLCLMLVVNIMWKRTRVWVFLWLFMWRVLFPKFVVCEFRSRVILVYLG